MSRAIEAFFERVESDRELQAELRRIATEHEHSAIHQIVSLANGAGFDFSERELAMVRASQLEYFPGTSGRQDSKKECCHYAQGCMPGFCPAVEA